MATKQEIVGGLEFLRARARDIGGRFTEADWAGPGDAGGWTAKQVYAHVAGLGALIPQFADGYTQAGPETDLGPNTPINDINAGLVGDRSGKSPAELAQEFDANYGKVIEWAKQQPEEFFEKRGTLGGYKNWTVGDLIMTAFVMHGVQHLYHASSRFP